MNADPLAALLARKTLLIFDFDGTIADSSPLHDRAFNEAFAREGVTVDYSRIAGLPTDAAVDMIAAEAGIALTADRRSALVRDKRERARRLIASELEALDGAIEFIRAAGSRFDLALCTSASRPTLEMSVARLGLDDCFTPIITAEDVTRGKPDPECFLEAVRFHGASPEGALVLEDADSGIAAARAAGIDVIRIVQTPPREVAEADWTSLNRALKQVTA